MQRIHPMSATHQLLDVLGATIEFLAVPNEAEVYCVIKGTIPPTMSVPLHSDPDAENYLVVSGIGQLLTERGGRFEWLDVKAGDFIHVPGGAKHAHRDNSNEPLVELTTTTATLGQFFLEIGRPMRPGMPLPASTPAELERFKAVAARSGHWLATPVENAAVGLSVMPRETTVRR